MDDTERFRRERQIELNAQAAARAELEAHYVKVWDIEQLRAEFEVLSFLAPYVIVRERATGDKGTLEFQHQPRFYFNWQPAD